MRFNFEKSNQRENVEGGIGGKERWWGRWVFLEGSYAQISTMSEAPQWSMQSVFPCNDAFDYYYYYYYYYFNIKRNYQK